MNYLNISLVFIFIFQAAQAEWNTQDFLKREHTLIRPYYGSGIDIPYWQFTGSTIVTPNYIRLTADLPSKSGAIWNTMPVFNANWELQIQFKVHGTDKELYGDGMAIWYTKDRLKEGPVFGSIDYFNGLAVMLDTYSNHNGPHSHGHPYISAMVNNGSIHYDHDRDGTHTQLAGCTAKFRNVKHDTHIAIRYENDVLTVSTDIENKKAWNECFKIEGVHLPTGYYLGLSAKTGDLSDNHDVLSVRLFDLDMPGDPRVSEDRTHIIPSASKSEPVRDHVEDEKPSMSKITIAILVFLVCSITVVCAVVCYDQCKEKVSNKKRFY
ncbi:vesicular integral-membrane protein VIP36 [Anthonomus grandis grandis]|uniref:vesicular integral-membrane protein VIP36 n=1 Tax=Anthonomus grandis grandis TaxID=2921223 RepID=UPI002165C148|nr:vesicular integral-membrane protein VIP36 [Anthonomus grandis grandis]